MSLDSAYEKYLAHFGETVPVSILHQEPDLPGLCAMRHDVDYDLDMALELAHWEHHWGKRATYFILPTAAYWEDDPRLVEKCLQLQDYGHEVGLHVNCLVEWATGKTDDPGTLLQNQLDRLREGGVGITGISAHGDAACYEYNISNYWCFHELRPQDPFASENGRTAEGLYDPDKARRLAYPENHEISRPDGARFPLWSVSMQSLGLHYHAWHTRFDRYFSDSGSDWKRTPDPMEYKQGRERWQVLMHPLYWRGPRRLYFFLSSARSGSRWLSEVLEQGTPLQARHEYILNQDFHRGETSHKATADIRRLENNPAEVNARLGEAWEELNDLEKDYAEVNVYLESFVEELRRFFPEATFVHLHRNPKDVVRSLMDRDWYDTPEDPNHPQLREVDAGEITRFERVCQYVAEANERLLQICDHRLVLETLTSGSKSLGAALRQLGIAYHPRLGQKVAREVINATSKPEFSKPKHWPKNLEYAFNRICGQCMLEMGYRGSRFHPLFIASAFARWLARLRDNSRRFQKAELLSEGPSEEENLRICGKYCSISEGDSGSIIIKPQDDERNAYMTLGGSGWHNIANDDGLSGISDFSSGNNNSPGWPVLNRKYVKGEISIIVKGEGSISIFGINYNQEGKQIYRRRLGALDSHYSHLDFAFDPRPDATRFDIALYMSGSMKPDSACLTKWRLVHKSH